MRGGSPPRPISRPNSFSSFGPTPGSAESSEQRLSTGGRLSERSGAPQRRPVSMPAALFGRRLARVPE